MMVMTQNSESPYSSIFGRWWPWLASSTASGCRPNSSCISSSSASFGSFIATHTKVSGRARYSLISCFGISAIFLPSVLYAAQLTSMKPWRSGPSNPASVDAARAHAHSPRASQSLALPAAAQRQHQRHARRRAAAHEVHVGAFFRELCRLQLHHVEEGERARLVLVARDLDALARERDRFLLHHHLLLQIMHVGERVLHVAEGVEHRAAIVRHRFVIGGARLLDARRARPEIEARVGESEPERPHAIGRRD